MINSKYGGNRNISVNSANFQEWNVKCVMILHRSGFFFREQNSILLKYFYLSVCHHLKN